ncbi:MAG: peptide-methionine (S)-S-oxide reductase MsrA [Candidatus Cyclobacteriaceae bacterium M3_2C_046]
MKWLLLTFFFPLIINCSSDQNNSAAENNGTYQVSLSNTDQLDTATFAGGCFWCVEAAFEQIKGVEEAVSGYAGGTQENPVYQEVAAGNTDHAETVQVYYNPDQITYSTLLDIFFTAHDPTQLNRQGPDVGPQYRSAIFYHDQEQKRLAQQKMDALENSPRFEQPIVTELNPLQAFWLAEVYHQDYEKKHPNDPYIQNVSRPKINKVRKNFQSLLKDKAE